MLLAYAIIASVERQSTKHVFTSLVRRRAKRYSLQLAHAAVFNVHSHGLALPCSRLGANTAPFSVMDAMLFRMLSVNDPQQLVRLRSSISSSTTSAARHVGRFAAHGTAKISRNRVGRKARMEVLQKFDVSAPAVEGQVL